jgi:hypothetical protein
LEEARVFLKIQVLFLSDKALTIFRVANQLKEEEEEDRKKHSSSSFQLLSQTLQTLTRTTTTATHVLLFFHSYLFFPLSFFSAFNYLF